MPDVHPSSVLDDAVELDDDVVIGPQCVLSGPIRIGRGTRLIGSVYLHGPLRLGADNVVYPFACLGFAPQHLKLDHSTPGHGLEIGDGNTFREHVTLHRAFSDEGPTRIGSGNYFMGYTHAGHDCQVGDGCVLVNGAMLAGHVTVQDAVTIGGGTLIQQFVRIGRGAMLAANSGLTLDLPPFFMVTGPNICGGVNRVGMRRRGLSGEEIDDVRWTYRVLLRSGLSKQSALDRLRERTDRPLVAECLEFIAGSKRPLCPAHGNMMRGTTGAAKAGSER